MPNARLAEFLLRRATTPDRASAIAGDLLEQQKSSGLFWFTLLRIIVTMTWRRILAIPVAMFSVFLGLIPYARFVVEPYVRQINQNVKPVHYGVQPLSPSMQVGSYIVAIGICLCTVAALALVRYGIRSRLTHLSCLLATMSIAGACFIQQHHALIYVPAILMTAVLLTLSYASSRRLLLCISAAGISLALSFIGAGRAISLFIKPNGTSEPFRSQPWIPFVMVLCYVSCVVAEAWVLSWTSRRLLSKEEPVIN